MSAKIGDTVRFLNDVGGGVIVKIKDNMAYVADEDGFETPVLLRECVVVASPQPLKTKPEAVVTPKPEPKATKAIDLPVEEEPVIETDGGDKLNIVFAFEAKDMLQLSKTSFDAYLVNDSNYYLYFTFMTRGDDENSWQTKYAGVVEPNYQLLAGSFKTSDLPGIERIAVQAIAFKRDRDFDIKSPVSFESRLDTSKFARLHCFHKNIYFDKPVIAFEIMKDDVACKSAVNIETVATKPVEISPARRPVTKRPAVSRRAQKNDEPLEIDLHAEKLLDDTRGLSNADILNYQIDTFRKVMDENIRNSGRRIVFIHGKGDGVLRKALLKELNYRYPSCHVQDASFSQYGYGATQVTINPSGRPAKKK